MDQLSLKVAALQQELDEKERTLNLAAKYGKGLLEQNVDLHSKMEEQVKNYGKKLEVFEQENYSFKKRLEARENEIENQKNEIELQETIFKNQQTRNSQNFEEKNDKLEKKVQSLKSSNEMNQEELQQAQLENEKLEGRLKETLELLSNREVSFNAGLEPSLDQSSCNIQLQLASLTEEKQVLEAEILELKNKMMNAHYRLERSNRSLKQVQDELESKECELTSQFNALERSRTECIELQVEIDQLRMNEIDPNRKGNSLFSEVEDKRQILEKQVLSLVANNSTLKNQNEMKSQQIVKMKLQLASLLNFRNSETDSEYVQQLEANLYSVRTQLNESVQRCSELQRKIEEIKKSDDVVCKNISNMDGKNSMFKAMYHESQSKVEELEKSLRQFRFEKVSQSDKISQLQKKIYLTEKETEALKSASIRLKVALEEAKTNRGDVDVTKVKVVKRITEKIPLTEKLKPEAVNGDEKKCLKEKFIRPNLGGMNEAIELRIDARDGIVRDDCENKENKSSENVKHVATSSLKQNKKAPKSVKMMDTVVVHDSNEEGSSTEILKSESQESKGPVKRKRQLKEMVASATIGDPSSDQNECTQQ